MERLVKNFWTEEDGNTTIDWMVLTAGLVLLGAAVMATIGSGSQSYADDSGAFVEESASNAGV